MTLEKKDKILSFVLSLGFFCLFGKAKCLSLKFTECQATYAPTDKPAHHGESLWLSDGAPEQIPKV